MKSLEAHGVENVPLSCTGEREAYRIENQHPPAYLVTASMLRDTTLHKCVHISQHISYISDYNTVYVFYTYFLFIYILF